MRFSLFVKRNSCRGKGKVRERRQGWARLPSRRTRPEHPSLPPATPVSCGRLAWCLHCVVGRIVSLPRADICSPAAERVFAFARVFAVHSRHEQRMTVHDDKHRSHLVARISSGGAGEPRDLTSSAVSRIHRHALLPHLFPFSPPLLRTPVSRCSGFTSGKPGEGVCQTHGVRV
jgi:hypothetical protein